MSEFAKQDIYNGEDYYEEYLALKTTLAKNPRFMFYGSENMILLTNSGSFFVIQGQIIVIFVVCQMSNRMAKKLSKYQKMRMMGANTYQRSQFDNFFETS